MSATASVPAHPPLKGGTLLLASFACSAGSFMVSLDATIANVSLTSITGDLGATTTQGSWIVTSYGIANAIAMLLTGWLTRRIGQVRLFVVAMLAFTLASLLCAMSSSLSMLIVFRVMQGLAAGPLFSLAMALYIQCYPPQKASQAISTQVMLIMVAPALGPIIGGWLTDNFSWPSIFLLNIPVGILASILAWKIFKERESKRVRAPTDYVGLVLLVIWVAALQTTLEQGRELDWFESIEVRVLAITAFVGFCFFLVWEWYEVHPIVDLSLFRLRNFSVGLASCSLGYFLFFAIMVLTPIWLRQTLGYTATWAGYVTAPVGFTALLLHPLSGRLIERFPPSFLAVFGCLALALFCFIRSGFSLQVHAEYIAWLHLLQGIGMAFLFMPLLVAMLSGISQDRLPVATGLANFVRFTAASLGTSVAISIWDLRTKVHHAQLSESINPYRALVPDVGDLPALAMIEREITRQAETIASNEYFFFATFMFLALIVILWFFRTPASHSRPGADEGGIDN